MSFIFCLYEMYILIYRAVSGFPRSFRNFFLYIEDKSLMKEKIAFVLLEMKMMWFKQKFLE